jgi:hypothetical protein
MLKEIASDVKDVKERLHNGDRRMDSFEREIKDLQNADAKTDADVAVLKGKVATLEPVVEIVSGIKKLVYGGLAMVFIIVIGSQVVPYLLKSKIGG